MCNFQYATKKELFPVRDELISIIKETQHLLRDEFTFRFDCVGSYKRNMVTYDPTSNIGFDFDVNLEVNDNDENSTQVITIKFKDRKNARIHHSCVFAIVNNSANEEGYKCQEYIPFDKKQNRYMWEEQSDGQPYAS